MHHFVEFSSGEIGIAELVRTTTAPGVDLIPTSPSLLPLGEQSENGTGLAIVRAFRRLPDYWDLIFVDTPPTTGYLSLAPLVASDYRRAQPAQRLVIVIDWLP
jgi:cellulose biosynthesis protein BcsQ